MRDIDVTEGALRALENAVESGGENSFYQETLTSVFDNVITIAITSTQGTSGAKPVWEPSPIRFTPTPDVCLREEACHYRSRVLGRMASSVAFGEAEKLLEVIDPEREKLHVHAGWEEAPEGIADSYSFEVDLFYFSEDGREQFAQSLNELTRF